MHHQADFTLVMSSQISLLKISVDVVLYIVWSLEDHFPHYLAIIFEAISSPIRRASDG